MKVFITRHIPGKAIDILLSEGFDVVEFGKNKPITRKEIIRYASDASGIISLLTDKFDEEVLSRLPECRVIANYAVGFNNIDIKAAQKCGITVTNTPDILTNATADIAFLLALSCARNFNEGEKLMRQGKFKGWEPGMLLGMEFYGKTFGIVGAGRIGSAVARRAKAFGCNIVYYSRSRNEVLENETGALKLSLTKLMKNSDIVSLHLPLSPKTYHLLDRDMLSLLKSTAILVNTARGEIVDEAALIDMLKEGKLFSAGFDVYENEPDVKKELLKFKNVVLLPHLGSATYEARSQMAELCARNVVNVLKGRKAITPVL